MRYILTLIVILLINLKSFATDLYVNSSGASGTYTTLSSALTAASDGDRIIISTLMNLIENVTIDKSVTITSAASGSSFVLNGTMTIEANSGKEIRIIGGDISSLSFSSGSGTDANPCKFYLVDSDISSEINASPYGLSVNILYCNMPNIGARFKFGSIIGSFLSFFELKSGTGTARNDTTKIIANKFTGGCTIYNQDHNYLIANNYFDYSSSYQLYISYSKPSNSGWNNIINNTFRRSSGQTYYGNNLFFENNYDYSNINIFNNYFYHNYNSSSSAYRRHIGGYNPSTTSYQPSVLYNVFISPYSGGVYWNNSLNSSTYNNQMLTSSGNTFSTVDGRVTAGAGINDGNTGINYYDINMTRNDVGTYGGPYSWDNYHDTTSNGKARVFNLDMPFEIWMGQTPTIKADAVHKK